MHVFAGSCLAALLVGSSLLAQRREPLVGTVHDAAGKPVDAAAVTLIEDDAELVGLGPVDVCRATTDARGHFKVSALVGVRYSALACGPEVAGQAMVARIVTGLSCGQIGALRLEVPGQRRTIAMPLEPELRAVAGVHVRMSWRGCAGHHLELTIGDQGIEVPPLAAIAELSLRDGRGAFLGSVHVPRSGDAMLPLPFRIAVRVVDEAGAPVAGARVAVQDRSTSTDQEGPPVLTDDRGQASLLWGGWQDPFDAEPDTFFVVATHAGYAEGASGWVYKEPFIGFEAKKHEARVLVVPLTRHGPVPRGAVDRSFTGRLARVLVMGNVRFRPGAHYFLPRQYDVSIAADGTYALPQLPPGATTVRLQLPPLDGRRIVLLPTVAPTLPSAVLADCDQVAVQVIDEGGGPALGAQVLLANGDRGSLFMQSVAVDAAGRFDRWLQRGRWVLLAMDHTGWATHEFDGEVPKPVDLRFTEKPHRRVRVLDGAGQPVAGASFEPGDFRYGFPVPFGLDALLQALGWNTLGEHLRRVRTDERGEATLHFLPWPNARPTAFAFVGDHRRRSDDVGLEAAADVLVFRLR